MRDGLPVPGFSHLDRSALCRTPAGRVVEPVEVSPVVDADVSTVAGVSGPISAPMVAALESAWAAIRVRHPEVPAVVLVLGAGSIGNAGGLRLGHFAAMRWADPDQTNATDEDAADGADGEPSIGQPVRLPEVFIGGEGLVRGAADVLGTLLHEAAHALAHVRDIKDTSRQGRWHNAKFKALAEELGIEVAKDPRIGWSPTAIPASTREEYAEVIDELGRVLRLHRAVEVAGGKDKKPSAPPCVCECGRKIRVSPTVLAAGPITCGVCGTDFTPDLPDQDDQDQDGDGDGTDGGGRGSEQRAGPAAGRRRDGWGAGRAAARMARRDAAADDAVRGPGAAGRRARRRRAPGPAGGRGRSAARRGHARSVGVARVGRARPAVGGVRVRAADPEPRSGGAAVAGRAGAGAQCARVRAGRRPHQRRARGRGEVGRLEHAFHGIGLVTADAAVDALVPAASGRAPRARRRTADRWVEELLYAAAIDAGHLQTGADTP